jgi:hypothetical protein
VVQEKGSHPAATSSQAGTFQIPYGLRDAQVNATKLAEFKIRLVEALKP